MGPVALRPRLAAGLPFRGQTKGRNWTVLSGSTKRLEFGHQMAGHWQISRASYGTSGPSRRRRPTADRMLSLTSHDHRPQLAANPRKLRTGMNAHVVPHVGSIVLGLTTDVLLIIGALFGRACITSVISRGATTSSPPRHAPSSNGNRRLKTGPRPPGTYGRRKRNDDRTRLCSGRGPGHSWGGWVLARRRSCGGFP